MEPVDLERIARTALRELGAGNSPMSISADTQADRWRIEVGGPDPMTIIVRAGAGTTPQYVREQIFTQFAGR